MRRALWRGLRNRCPGCGAGPWRSGYLTPVPACRACGTVLGHIRADDGPAYFTVLAVGHLTVPAVLVVEQHWHPPLAPFVAGALVSACLLIWQLLPRIKGAMLGAMWAMGLTGEEKQDQTGF
jgi:uncharacterized protein (DUF983 family)